MANLGWKWSKEKSYDLILVDLMMPVMGGLEMMEQVRQIDPGIILVVITGFATVETAVDAMKHGAYDYIPKPFNPDQLMAVINRGLDKRRLTIEKEKLREERDQRLLEVASEKSKLHTIVNSMADGILVINREHQLVLWNPAVLKMLNVTGRVDSGVGMDYQKAMRQKDLVEVINKAFSPDFSQYTIISEEVVLSGETQKTLMVIVAGVRDEKGENLGVVCTFRDISETQGGRRSKISVREDGGARDTGSARGHRGISQCLSHGRCGDGPAIQQANAGAGKAQGPFAHGPRQ